MTATRTSPTCMLNWLRHAAGTKPAQLAHLHPAACLLALRTQVCPCTTRFLTGTWFSNLRLGRQRVNSCVCGCATMVVHSGQPVMDAGAYACLSILTYTHVPQKHASSIWALPSVSKGCWSCLPNAGIMLKGCLASNTHDLLSGDAHRQSGSSACSSALTGTSERWCLM